jgi:hypothetical protein
MKNTLILFFAAVTLAGIFPARCLAQDSTGVKKKPYLQVKYINENGFGRVHFKLFTKQGTQNVPVRFTVINLFLSEESKWGMMGNITTDTFGEGAVPLHDRFAKASASMPEYHLFGSAKDDPRLEWVQTFITIKPATLTLSLYQQDSVKYAKAVLKERDSTGAWIPVQGVNVDFCVKKYYTPLKGATTDENGEAILQVPDGLKGDSEGKVTIGTTVEAPERFGTLIATQEEKWGVADNQASLMEKLVSISLIAGVWGFIIYLIVKLFRGKAVAQNQ